MDKKKYNAEVKPATVKFTASIPDPVVSTTPAKKYLIGSQIEDLRDRVSLAPTVIAETLDMVYSTAPSISKALIDGKNQNVYTYKSGKEGEASFISLSKKVDIPTILKTAKELTDYADKNGTMKKTADGLLSEIEINDYLRHLGYTPRPDGSFGIRDKRKVWKDLKEVFNTPVKRAVRFKSGDKDQVVVFQAPIIHYAEIYDGDDTKKAIALNSDNPPPTFLVGIQPEVAKQMTGFNANGLYYHKDLVAEPRRKAIDYKHDLTGYKQAVSTRLFMLLKGKVAPIRRYAVKDLTEVIGGRERDRVGKLVKALDLFEKRGDIKSWGFCNSRNKTYNKTEKRAKLIIIDHSDTDVLRKYQEFYKSKKSEVAKIREEVKRLKKEQKKTSRKITKLEKDY